MPNIYTHVLFADEVNDLLKLDVMLGRKQLFEIGANGPDPLFFHGISPWKSPVISNTVRKIGAQLHIAHTNDFYESAIRSIRNEKNNQIKDDMIIYTCGHLCHWALDSVMHPYVYYRTGFNTGRSSWDHHRFESLIDALMLKYKRDTNINEFNIDSVTAFKPFQARAMARIYVPAVKDIFNLEIRPYVIEEALQDWNDMQHVFKDPKGRKIKAARILEKPLKLDNLISGYAVPPVAEDNYDLFNLMHKTWKNPATLEESDASWLDLWDIALKRALKAIRLFLEAISDDKKEKEFLDWLDNRDYCTSTDGMKMSVSDPVDLSV